MVIIPRSWTLVTMNLSEKHLNRQPGLPYVEIHSHYDNRAEFEVTRLPNLIRVSPTLS
jgi:hypothetical protein